MAAQSKPQEGCHLLSFIADSPEQCQKFHKDYPETQCRRFASEVAVREYLIDSEVHGEFHYCSGVDTEDFFEKLLYGRDDDVYQTPPSEKPTSEGTTKVKAYDPMALIEGQKQISKVREHIVALLSAMETLGRFENRKGGSRGFPFGGLRELASNLIIVLGKKFPPHAPDPSFDESGSPFQPGQEELEYNCRQEVLAHRNRFLLDWDDHRVLLQRDHPGRYLKGDEPGPFQDARKMERTLQEGRIRCFNVRMQQATSSQPMSEAEASAYINRPSDLKTPGPSHDSTPPTKKHGSKATPTL